MTQAPPPAGWYPQGDQERWWDGNAWSDNFRPVGSGQLQQPTPTAAYQQPYQQPTYGQPQQPYAVQPVKQSHTGRNILIVIGVLFILMVGGCFAVVAVVGNEVNDAVNDETVGGPNNPLTITEGEAFEVNGFEYDDGWEIVDAPVSGLFEITNLKVTNDRGKSDRLNAQIRLLNGNEVVATTLCYAGEGLDKIPEDTTVTVNCTAQDPLPAAYDKITISDLY